MTQQASTAIFRFYRPIIVPVAVILVLVELIGVFAVTKTVELGFSFWVVIAGSMGKYWMLVVGVMLVTMQLRQFVTNGVTRREFMAGAAVFVLTMAVGFATVIVLGHWLEGTLAGAIGERGPAYPVLSAGEMPGEFGRVLPQELAWAVSGGLIAIGFYRFKPWLGLIVMVFGAVPVAVVEALLAIDEQGGVRDLVPYVPALLLSLAATGLAAVAFRYLARDVAIRRTAG